MFRSIWCLLLSFIVIAHGSTVCNVSEIKYHLFRWDAPADLMQVQCEIQYLSATDDSLRLLKSNRTKYDSIVTIVNEIPLENDTIAVKDCKIFLECRISRHVPQPATYGPIKHILSWINNVDPVVKEYFKVLSKASKDFFSHINKIFSVLNRRVSHGPEASPSLQLQETIYDWQEEKYVHLKPNTLLNMTLHEHFRISFKTE